MNKSTALLRVLSSVLLIIFASRLYAKPNIILILADDLGYCELGSFGQTRIRTPHLNKLAAEGMRLTQHYSGSAVCAPSRCVLMTGRHPGHACIRDNREIQPEGQHPIQDGEMTLAKLLKKQGYTTGAFGKWGLGGPKSEGEPLAQGFDHFYGYNCQRHAHSYYPAYLWNNRERIELINRPPIPGHAGLSKDADPKDPRSYDRFKGQDYAPDRINAKVLTFIRQHKEQSFFLYYATVIPHLALHVPDEELEPYLKLGWYDPPFTREKRGYAYTPHYTPRAAYAAMITRMDRYVGNVLKLLDELKLANNTIVVFSSDNGTSALREVDSEFFKSVGELRGLKGSLYEGGIRVPTIVRWPGIVGAGSKSNHMSGFEDWIPTFMELIGKQDSTIESMDGISFAPTLRGEQQEARPFLYREFGGQGGQQSIRVGNWKALRTHLQSGKPRTELYDLSADPGEQNDVAARHQDVVSRLETLMEREHTHSELFPLIPQGTRSTRRQ